MNTMDIRSFYTPKTETELPAEMKAWIDGLPETGRTIVLNELRTRLDELTKTEPTLTISFTLPLASLAEATKTSPEWLIEHQGILSDYMRGYWVYEDELDDSNAEMLTQAVEAVKEVVDGGGASLQNGFVQSTT